MEIGDTGYSYDRSDMGFIHLNAPESLKFVELTDLDLSHLVGVVVVYDDAFLIHFQGSVVNLAHTDAAYIFVVVDGTDQHLCAGFRIALRSRDIIDDRLEKRLHARARASHIESRNAGFGRCEHEGTVDLFVACAKVH